MLHSDAVQFDQASGTVQLRDPVISVPRYKGSRIVITEYLQVGFVNEIVCQNERISSNVRRSNDTCVWRVKPFEFIYKLRKPVFRNEARVVIDSVEVVHVVEIGHPGRVVLGPRWVFVVSALDEVQEQLFFLQMPTVLLGASRESFRKSAQVSKVREELVGRIEREKEVEVDIGRSDALAEGGDQLVEEGEL